MRGTVNSENFQATTTKTAGTKMLLSPTSEIEALNLWNILAVSCVKFDLWFVYTLFFLARVISIGHKNIKIKKGQYQHRWLLWVKSFGKFIPPSSLGKLIFGFCKRRRSVIVLMSQTFTAYWRSWKKKQRGVCEWSVI